MVLDSLTIAQGVAAGKLFILVGKNGVPVDVTDAGLISSIDEIVRDTVNHATYGNEALYDILSSGAVSIDLDAIIEDIGNPSARTNLDSIEEILGWQDVVSVQPIADVLGAGASGRYKTSGSLGADMSTLIDTRLTSARAGYMDELSGGAGTIVAEVDQLALELSGATTTGTHSHTADVNEQDVIEFSKTNIYSILSLSIDISNFTSGRKLTVKLYEKVDGTNYQEMERMIFTAGTHPVIALLPMPNRSHNLKVTMQIDIVETGAISCPFRYVLSDHT